MAILYPPKFLSTDALFWLKASHELQKTEAKQFDTHHLSKLEVRVKKFDEPTHEALKRLHEALVGLDGVERVSSLFSNDFVETKKGSSDSEMLTVINTGELDTLRLHKLLKERDNDYSNMVEDDYHTFYYFISGENTIDISGLEIPGSYLYDAKNGEIEWPILGSYTLIFLLIMVVVFRLLFRNYVVFFSALMVIGLSTVLTFTLIVMLTGIETMHITMPFITISIALVDFLYFYYRWHVSQYKVNRRNAVIKMLNRSMLPALWTSVITMLGLGSLVFIDSEIIRLLSLSVIISSVTGYMVNLTFLPAMLSYFELEHTHVPYAKIGYFLLHARFTITKRSSLGFWRSPICCLSLEHISSMGRVTLFSNSMCTMNR
ncbi:RND transporter family protein [Sulfurovum mangrovi]|uniref:hypothetical protein n=1 Tax=Sulfurovum mangrovi TaxID=2893889 RepID=UPI001E50011B|nr:hypothetical protein [Sulfurovum mangrovi]UFH60602.1 hypothetical protein LN246_13565 [Sulfurovum mangrovi]